MKSLHWLPIAYRIRFKLCVLMHGVHNRTSPSYLTDATIPISSLPGHRRLHSVRTTEYNIPCTRTNFEDRAFSFVGPREWNDLFADIRNITDFSSFKWAIKIHFCNGIFRLNSFTIPDCTMFSASGQFLGGGCKMRHINEFLLTYLLTYWWTVQKLKLYVLTTFVIWSSSDSVASKCDSQNFQSLWDAKWDALRMDNHVFSSLISFHRRWCQTYPSFYW